MSWLSKQLEKSKRKKTGIFSWGDSDLAKGIDLYIPGAGTALDAGLDAIATNPASNSSVNPKTAINVASFASNNQMVLYAIGGLVAYKVFFK